MAQIIDSTQPSAQLRCRICGNDSRFIQVMEHVENLVDANYDHVHLLIGIPDSYYCKDCGERIDQGAVD
jgi:DNA-directed RNA polymerase subunit RPC12/RpoP